MRYFWSNSQILLAAVALLLSPVMESPARAAFMYDETRQGDISEDFDDPVFVFRRGKNVLSGDQFARIGVEISVVRDFDNFEFIIPRGLELVSASYAFNDLRELSSNSGITVTSVFETPPSATDRFAVSTAIQINPTAIKMVDLWSSELPKEAGTYRYRQNLGRGNGDGGSWDYTLTFHVTPVPAAFPLLVGSLAVVGLLWQRSQYQRR